MPASQLDRIDLDRIYPEAVPKYAQLLANCNDRGCVYRATSGYRSLEEQMKLWQKGRDAKGAVIAPKAIVTNLRFGAHQTGGGIDFVRDVSPNRDGSKISWDREDYRCLAEEAEKLGFESGFFWRTFPDAPHVQLRFQPLGLTFVKMRRIYEEAGGGDAGLKKLWSEFDRLKVLP